jgi:class 3 adenylate cyclase
VNLASRLEQLNTQFGSRVLVSETVAERLDGAMEQAKPHGAIQVKGREQPVQVYELA